MKKIAWQSLIALGLVVASVITFTVHYLIFKDTHHIFIYGLGDLAFLPLEVLLVTLIIHEVLTIRDKRARLEKLNMVIGAFFSEAGTELVTYLSDFDPKLDDIRKNLVVTSEWSDQDFKKMSSRLKNYDYSVEMEIEHLKELRVFLNEKKDFLLRLIENPNLLEHEEFTEALRAIFHLTEELSHREDLENLPETDQAHIKGDISRAYVNLVHQWLDYMKHLKENYPYLFSLAMRTNPFDQSASPIVK